MNELKRPLGKVAAVLLIVGLAIIANLQAQTPQEKGRQIMEAVDALPRIERMISETVLDIYDAQGRQLFSKKSRTATYVENFQDKDKRRQLSISYFFAPADDQGNGALMVENLDGEDDQWIYLKGLRKPKRVVGSDKSSSFMGSDFSNGDVAARNIDDAVYTWLGTETLTFKERPITVEKIESVFKEPKMRSDYGYSKTISWMHPQSGLPFQLEIYNLNGQLAKTTRLLSFAVHQNRDGQRVFIPTGMEMTTVLRGTKTVMQMQNIQVEAAAGDIEPGIFREEYLTRRWW
jgi:hypothetical protein